MRIVDVRATTVTMPLEAPLRHSNGAHWGRFVRTVVEIEADNGLVGLGEMGGGGQSAEDAVAALKPYLVGHDPVRTEALRWMLANPTASLYNNRTQLLAAVEFACLDLRAASSAYRCMSCSAARCGTRCRSPAICSSAMPPTTDGGDQDRGPVGRACAGFVAEHGFTVHKLKGGSFRLTTNESVSGRLPRPSLGTECGSTPTAPSGSRRRSGSPGASRTGQRLSRGPHLGLNGMRRVRENTSIPLATNTVVVNFEQLAANVRDPAVDVILLDTTFWGGIRACVKAAGVCETFQLGVAVHSSGELGIQLATMLQLGAVVPNLSFAADAHYHHLRDDIIAGGKLPYAGGAIAVPDGPGLGVELDRDKLAEYAELFRELGPYPYDRDPARPGWYPLLPNTDWADPTEGLR